MVKKTMKFQPRDFNSAVSDQEFDTVHRDDIFLIPNLMRTLPSSRYVPISYVFDSD